MANSINAKLKVITETSGHCSLTALFSAEVTGINTETFTQVWLIIIFFLLFYWKRVLRSRLAKKCQFLGYENISF